MWLALLVLTVAGLAAAGVRPHLGHPRLVPQPDTLIPPIPTSP